MVEILGNINDWLWTPLVVFALGFGLLLTILTRGMQIRLIPDMVKQIWSGEKSDKGISSFQALSLTLSSRIGVGNIAGVATAIAAGGPGALFWMAVMGFLGTATAFVESTLAQVYKRDVDGQFRGGIPFYIEKGLGWKKIAIVAAAVTALLYAVLAPGIQSNNIAAAFDSAFGISPWILGTIMTLALGYIIMGGRKRIIAFVQAVVPWSALAYIVAAIVVLAYNFSEVPAVFGMVLGSAFGVDSVFGGIVGAAIAWGVRRAMFSNVAGVGEGTFGAAAAQVSHPAKQGLVQSFSIYFDTLFVCMATGFMILVTDSFNVQPPGEDAVVTNLPGTEDGPAWTQAAVNSVFAGAGGPMVAISIAFFAFTTLVAFYYIAETNLTFIFKRQSKVALTLAKLAIMFMTMFGAVQAADLIWAIGDVGYASLAWVNMICVTFLIPVALKTLRDYERQKKAGLDPQFDPEALGIKNADYWNSDEARQAREVAKQKHEDSSKSPD